MTHRPTLRLLPATLSTLLLGTLIGGFGGTGLASAAAPATPATPTITLNVDLSSAPQRRFVAHETLSVAPGALTLHFPKWIPGEHGPTGPINGLTGLVIRAGGKMLPWRRDLADMFDLHVTVPEGTTQLDLDFQYIPAGDGQFSSSPSATPHLAELEWNQVVFYPAGKTADAVIVSPSLRVPKGWQFATALEASAAQAVADRTQFEPVSLETLIDSPVFTGEYFKRIDLGVALGAPVHLNLIADHPANLEMKPEQLQHARNMVQQAARLAGAVHYKHYDFLFALSEHTGEFGLEHHQSSDDRLGAEFYTDPEKYLADPALLTHEYFHSWNGKFRRPKGLATSDYNQPMLGDLLWVYEGMTNYYGEVLAARSGGWTAEQFRDRMALTAADMQYQTGRAWRPLQDTADAAQMLYGSPRTYNNWRRSVDYYPEGSLLWLEVDTRLRTLTKGKRSLDDFVKAFHGQHPGTVEVLPYDMDEVVRTLQGVAAFDWKPFLEERLQAMKTEAPIDGLTQGGWKLVYTDTPTEYFKASTKTAKIQQQSFDIGLLISQEDDKKGTILDVIWDGPAFKAGLTPGVKLLAVNGEDYTAEELQGAITAAATGGPAITLLVKDGSVYSTYVVNYTGGLRYPRLEAIKGATDLIGQISAPLK